MTLFVGDVEVWMQSGMPGLPPLLALTDGRLCLAGGMIRSIGADGGLEVERRRLAHLGYRPLGSLPADLVSTLQAGADTTQGDPPQHLHACLMRPIGQLLGVAFGHEKLVLDDMPLALGGIVLLAICYEFRQKYDLSPIGIIPPDMDVLAGISRRLLEDCPPAPVVDWLRHARVPEFISLATRLVAEQAAGQAMQATDAGALTDTLRRDRPRVGL